MADNVSVLARTNNINNNRHCPSVILDILIKWPAKITRMVINLSKNYINMTFCQLVLIGIYQSMINR